MKPQFVQPKTVKVPTVPYAPIGSPSPSPGNQNNQTHPPKKPKNNRIRISPPKLGYNLLLTFIKVIIVGITLLIAGVLIMAGWGLTEGLVWLINEALSLVNSSTPTLVAVPTLVAILIIWIPRILISGFLLLFALDVWNSLVILAEWEACAVYRLGPFRRGYKAGFAIKWPLIESWGKTLNMQLQVESKPVNKAFTRDNVATDSELTLHWQLNQDEPWRAEIEVEDPREFVLTSSEATVREVTGSFKFDEISGKRKALNQQLLENCREKTITQKEVPEGIIEDSLTEEQRQELVKEYSPVKVKMLALTDTEAPASVVDGLARRAVEVALATGREEAAQKEVGTKQFYLQAARGYVQEGNWLGVSEGQVAMHLRDLTAFREIAGEEGTGWFSLPNLSLADMGLGQSGQSLETMEKMIRDNIVAAINHLAREGKIQVKGT